MRKLLLQLIAFCAFYSPLSAQIVINEYSCSNISTLADNYGNYEDWVELYNTSGSSVDISGYYMSDKASNPLKWQIPSGTSVPANGYLVIIFSGLDEVSGGNIHAGLKLTQTKPESLVLADASGSVLESYTLNPAQTDHSRGRITDGASSWGLFTTPTPGSANNNAKNEYTPRPVMSSPQGFYSGAMNITISCSDPTASIYYTTDGSEPTTSSTLYSSAVNVASTTVIRARAFSTDPNTPPSFIESNTYFINVSHSLAVVSIFGDEVDELFAGSQGEPSAVVEYFDRNLVYKTEATGTSNKHGNDSWFYDQRGVDFVTRDQFGYNYALLDQLFSRKNRDEFQRIILKAAANDNYPFESGGAHIRDAYVHTLSQDGSLHLDERTYEPCILYMNGQYWGVYEIREKVDDNDFTDYYDNQDVPYLQFLKTWGGTWSEYGGTQAQTDWNNLLNFITTNNMAVQANYDYVDSLYNVKSLADYVILNSYTVCSDWLNWNTAWWRGLDPNGDKKKWRYTLWDNDATFGHYINYTGIPSQTTDADPCAPESLGDPGGQGHIPVLLKLMENPGFENFYINRFIDLTNTVFACSNMENKLDSMINVISPEMNGQITRWGGTMTEWQANVQAMRDFITQRCTDIQQGMIDCYNLTGPYTITIDVSPPLSGQVSLNSIDIYTYPWTGTFYGGITSNLVATPNANYVFDYWEMSGNTPLPSDQDSVITVDFQANDVIVAHFKIPSAIFVPTAFSPNGDGINDVLKIQGEGILSLNFDIYDRWGQQVFHTNDPNTSWDGTFKGKPLNSAVFAYKITAKIQGVDEVFSQSGNISLIR